VFGNWLLILPRQTHRQDIYSWKVDVLERRDISFGGQILKKIIDSANTT